MLRAGAAAADPCDGPGTFATLQGLRAVAAVAVVILHAPRLFAPLPAGSAYLAVDLFFLISGFVISHRYRPRLASGLTAGAFLRLRVIRLYPLYLVGLAAGVAAASAAAFLRPGSGHDLAGVATAAGFALAMMPAPASSPSAMLFPVNAVAWTLLLELAINAAYALTWRQWTGARLLALIAAGAMGVAVAGLSFGTLDIGWTWSTALGGLPRVVFGFGCGVLLHQLWQGGRWRVSAAPLAVIGLAIVMLVAVPAMSAPSIGVDLAILFAGWPILVWLAASSEPRGRVRIVMQAAGGLSYGIYVLHQPLVRAVPWAAGFLSGGEVAPLAPASGLVALMTIVFVAWVLGRTFDCPVRAWLSAPRTASADA